ncbi:MAG: type II CRISPR-associated endonuclease Cas1 [Sarcina sp.]
MSWRTVIIKNKCKLSYKNNSLLIRNDMLNMIHLSEINTLVIETTMVSITSILLSECIRRKIKIIFCDERHNPQSELVSYYGSHNTSKKIIIQTKWNNDFKETLWMMIIKNKIECQASLLEKYQQYGVDKLLEFRDEVNINDITNREGHSAKVYFNSLFGKDFSRDKNNDINSALDYGYSIILSNFNREIVGQGYITQLGIKHRNEFNYFNLSCDLMEVFRTVIDDIVIENKKEYFDNNYKTKLIDCLNKKVKIEGKEYYVSNAINLYVNSIFKCLEKNSLEYLVKVERI